jgi:hypothetical protein
MCPMPCAAVGVELGIGRVGERGVHRPSLLGPRASVDRGPEQRMVECDAAGDSDQLGLLGANGGVGGEAECRAGAPEKRQITQRLGRGEQEQSLRVIRKLLDAQPEARLDPALERRDVRHCEAAREARAVERARKLEQRERVAPRLGDDPVAHRVVQDAEVVRLEHCTGVLVRQAPEAQLG